MGLTPTLNAGRREWFGDVVCREEPDGSVSVLEAPPVTRIALDTLSRPWFHTRMDDSGRAIVVAEQVWYEPFDLDPVTMTLICCKTRDLRPLVTQARQEVAAR